MTCLCSGYGSGLKLATEPQTLASQIPLGKISLVNLNAKQRGSVEIEKHTEHMACVSYKNGPLVSVGKLNWSIRWTGAFLYCITLFCMVIFTSGLQIWEVVFLDDLSFWNACGYLKTDCSLWTNLKVDLWMWTFKINICICLFHQHFYKRVVALEYIRLLQDHNSNSPSFTSLEN